MRRFSANLNFVKTSLEISKTLMVENIAKDLCKNEDKIIKYFKVSLFINTGQSSSNIGKFGLLFEINPLL